MPKCETAGTSDIGTLKGKSAAERSPQASFSVSTSQTCAFTVTEFTGVYRWGEREVERELYVCMYVSQGLNFRQTCCTRYNINVLSGCSQSVTHTHTHTHTPNMIYTKTYYTYLQTGVMRSTRDAAGWIRSCFVQEEAAASRPC
jgi:hypothetical protein